MKARELKERLVQIGISDMDSLFVYDDVKEMLRYQGLRLKDVINVFKNGNTLTIKAKRMEQRNEWMSSWTVENYNVAVSEFYK